MTSAFNETKNPFSSNTLTTITQLDENHDENNESSCCDQFCLKFIADWWKFQYKHQHFVVHLVEKTAFHVVIISLVLLDCLLVVGELLLDFILLNEKCNAKNGTKSSSEDDDESKYHGLEMSIEVLHIGSIVLLSFFVFEVLVKIYAFGRTWWNFRERKMEWLDALIVIASFVIDIYFSKKPSVVGEISLLFISFRLWRIIRIINSVAQSMRSQDETAKKNLAHTYTQIIELLLTVSINKTQILTELRADFHLNNFDDIIEKFANIDSSCKTSLQNCPKLASRHAATDVAQQLQDVLEQVRSTSAKLTSPNSNPRKHL